MWLQSVFFFCAFLAVNTQDEVKDDPTKLAEGEKKLSENILAILEHFKQPDPVGLPGAIIPDPYPGPDTSKSLGFGTTLYFKNTAVYGTSKCRVLHVNAEIRRMEVQAALEIAVLQARGNYTMTSWLNYADGPFTVDITDLKMTARGTLGVQRSGKLRVQDINIDLEFKTITADFKNLGVVAGMFQSIVNSGETFLFDSIKPFFLEEAYTKARDGINAQLDELAGDLEFPNSISPLDMVIIDARNKVRDINFDPYQIKDYNQTMSLITITLSNTFITGISSFQRNGNITLKMENNAVVADFEIGTQKLQGTTQWTVSAVSGFLSKVGSASFSVEFINARIILTQPLDTRRKPILNNLNLEIGNIQARCNGVGTIDYIVELAVNILPNLLRYQIIDGIEIPLKERIQKELQQLNVEDIIKEELPILDDMQGSFKLSALRSLQTEEKNYDEDEFFNF